MQTVKVANVEEAIELASNLKREGKFNWFRGQLQANWEPSTSQERRQRAGMELGEINDDINLFLDWAVKVPELTYLEEIANEHALFAIRQHYGYPTNYIDFTTEPSVAGFFASDTKIQPEKDTVSAIFCLNTEHLVAFYKEYGPILHPDIEAEPVSVDVSNLWRLQAQHGHFLRVNHTWYNVYKMYRIEFPWTGLPAYPARHQIYPEQKSHLEILLDEFASFENRIKSEKYMKTMIEELKNQGVQMQETYWTMDPARYEKSAFNDELVPLESWSQKNLSQWLSEHQENFHEVVGKIIDVRVRSEVGAPPAHLQIRTAFLGALSREVGLRARAVVWKIDGLLGLKDINHYLSAIQSAWNGMRNLPYENADIAEAMENITQLFLIGNCDSSVGHIMDSAFNKWKPDSIRIEFGSDVLKTISRAHCSSNELLECVDAGWKLACKDQKIVSSIFDAFFTCSRPDMMFDFDRFAKIFARQIIPTQLSQRRQLILFNPAKLSFVGNP